jgi:hypothetical protein
MRGRLTAMRPHSVTHAIRANRSDRATSQGGAALETIIEALQLLNRRAEIQGRLRRGRGSSVIDERELYLIHRRLNRLPATVQAIALTAAELHRPIEYLSARDVLRHC